MPAPMYKNEEGFPVREQLVRVRRRLDKLEREAPGRVVPPEPPKPVRGALMSREDLLAYQPAFPFGRKSLRIRSELTYDMARLVTLVAEHMNISLIEGVRTLERQKELLANKKTTTLNSKHLPNYQGNSGAVDMAPYPIDWDDTHQMYMFGGFVRGVAVSNGIPIRAGQDWDGDFDLKDQTFNDLVHFEEADH